MERTKRGAWLLGLALCGCGLGDPSATALGEAPNARPTPPASTQAQARPGPASETRGDQGGGAPARVHRATRAELLPRLREPLSRSSRDLAWRPRADGGKGLALSGRFQHAMVARRDADGRLLMSCVGSPEAAERALAERTP